MTRLLDFWTLVGEVNPGHGGVIMGSYPEGGGRYPPASGRPELGISLVSRHCLGERIYLVQTFDDRDGDYALQPSL